MRAKRQLIWLSVCCLYNLEHFIVSSDSSRTQFINEKALICDHHFEDDTTFSMTSYHSKKDEYFVGSKDILYEVNGATLDHSSKINYKELFNKKFTNFDLKVLHYFEKSRVMVCGLMDTSTIKNKGVCFSFVTFTFAI